VRLPGEHLCKIFEGTRSAEHRPHLDPVPEQHDIDQGGEFPEEPLAGRAEDHRGAVEVGDGDRDRDQGHHPGRPAFQFAYNSGEERIAAVEVDCGCDDQDDIVCSRHLDAEPEEHLDGRREDEDGNREDDRDDEPAFEVFDGMPVVTPSAVTVGLGRPACRSGGIFLSLFMHRPVVCMMPGRSVFMVHRLSLTRGDI